MINFMWLGWNALCYSIKLRKLKNQVLFGTNCVQYSRIGIIFAKLIFQMVKNNSHLHLPNWIFHNFQVLWMDIQNNFLIQTSFQKISFLKGIFRGYWSNGCGIQKSPHSRFNSIFHNTLLKNSGNIIKLHTAYHLSFKTEYLCYPQQKTKIHTHYTYNITATKKYN